MEITVTVFSQGQFSQCLSLMHRVQWVVLLSFERLSIQFNTVQCGTVQYKTLHYSAVQYIAAERDTVMFSISDSLRSYHTVQYSVSHTTQYKQLGCYTMH